MSFKRPWMRVRVTSEWYIERLIGSCYMILKNIMIMMLIAIRLLWRLMDWVDWMQSIPSLLSHTPKYEIKGLIIPSQQCSSLPYSPHFNLITLIISDHLSIHFFISISMEPIPQDYSPIPSIPFSLRFIILINPLSLPSLHPGLNSLDSLWLLFSPHIRVSRLLSPFHLHRSNVFLIQILMSLLILRFHLLWISL